MHSLFDLQKKVVVIAGAAGAFGSEIAIELADRGCFVSLFDKDEESLDRVVDRLSPAKTHHLVFDAADDFSCSAAMSDVMERWGRIDAMVNCVGVFEIFPSVEMPDKIFTGTLNVNLNAAFFLSRNAAKHMIPRHSGRIINIASVSDSIANPGYAAYASSKAGLSQLTRVLSVEWAEYSITVNAISPAISDTQLTHSFLEDGDNRQYALSRIPMKRFFEPKDILGTVILLLSEGGSFITGQSIHIDGGRTIS